MRFNPDASLRSLERIYEAVPSPENLVHYWSAKLRAGYFLELTEISAGFSSYSPLQQLLMDNYQRLTLFNVPYAEIFERIRLESFLLLEEIANQEPGAHQSDNVFISYIGFLPHFYASNDSQHQILRELGSVPGLLVLANDALNPILQAFHFSIYPNSTGNIEIDREAIFHQGVIHLSLIANNSCLANPGYAPLQISNFESVIVDDVNCYPLISIYAPNR